MDAPLVYASLLLLLVLGCGLYFARSMAIPQCVMPMAQLDEQTRQTLVRRKFRLRAVAVVLLTLAAISLFSSMPRAVTLIAALGGFYCQYRVFRLRRRHPMSGAAHIPGRMTLQTSTRMSEHQPPG